MGISRTEKSCGRRRERLEEITRRSELAAFHHHGRGGLVVGTSHLLCRQVIHCTSVFSALLALQLQRCLCASVSRDGASATEGAPIGGCTRREEPSVDTFVT